MGSRARSLSLVFAAGAVGALANSLTLWGAGRAGLLHALGVDLGPALTPGFLYPRLVWGGLWGALLLLPLSGGPMRRGLLVSLAPTAVQLFVVFPQAGRGIGGLELGAATPAVVLAANAVWGVAASAWLRLVRG